MSTERKVALARGAESGHALSPVLEALELPRSTWYYHQNHRVSYTAKYAHLRGKRPWIAGDVTYRGKGFTLDLASREQMYDLLDKNAFHNRLSEDEVKLAQRFAYLWISSTCFAIRLRCRPTIALPFTVSMNWHLVGIRSLRVYVKLYFQEGPLLISGILTQTGRV